MRDLELERVHASYGFSPYLFHPEDRPGRCPSCSALLGGRWALRAWLSVVEVVHVGRVKVVTCCSHYCRAQVERIARGVA